MQEIKRKEEPSDKLRDEMAEVIEKTIEQNEKIIKTNEAELEEWMITVFGQVELSPQEKMFLRLGLYFPLMEEMKEGKAARNKKVRVHQKKTSNTIMAKILN